MSIELIEGDVIQYSEVVLGFTVDDLRFAMGYASADPGAEDLEDILLKLATHVSYAELLMDGLRQAIREKQ